MTMFLVVAIAVVVYVLNNSQSDNDSNSNSDNNTAQTKFNKGTSSNIFLVGFIGSHLELDSLKFAFNNAFFLENVSVTVAHVNITG